MVSLVREPVHQGFALGERLIALRLQIDLLEIEFCRLAAELDRGQAWEDEGFNSALDWIRFNCKMTSNAAADRVTVGERISGLARSAASVESGQIGFAHLAVMARTADAVGSNFDETKLLELAIKNSPGKFHYKCLHYRHALDADRYQAEQDQLMEDRRLSLSTAQDGCLLLHGILDPVGGAALRRALEPLVRKSGAHDDRTFEQRCADALVELATAGKPVHLQVTSSVETLLALTGAPGAEMEFSLPICSRTVERWACDGNLSRVLLQDSVVIDVGRTKRVLEGSMRRALKVRDGHCRWPACERPASWCDGHHLVHWSRGGSTDLDNLVSLCGRHHRLVHEGGWQLVKGGDGEIVTVAPTVMFGSPRGPD